ncbi:Crp/Fnr family transcriptional regulator [Olivibacter sp. SDN3]|uniref:Crp/Fnr family transcriptional regulator n=1 Tax=Olivibacter sp. SDN3 TaxID=2764720 RepID=UPI001650E726|nr:Crp/Fnr family transcriptional regulator [Olivibacter sp. SDN3]QNL50144.1 Crp/Fnr family transcriptional regulator [Olivibacter sp. SDN3]
MNEILKYIGNISRLEEQAQGDFLKAFQVKSFKKGDYLLRADKVCKEYYFIKEGLTKSFFFNDEKEFIMKFFKENMFFTEISSYVIQKPSKYMILALEDTTVYAINKTSIQELCKKHHCIETLFSKLFSFTTLGMMKRISEMLEDNATKRHQIFVNENKGLLQRISLGDLANYLGITQVSLSRIRSSK